MKFSHCGSRSLCSNANDRDLHSTASTVFSGPVCGTYGRNYVIISEYNGNGAEDNIAIFTDSGTLLGTYRHGPPSTLISTYGMRLSGDGSRIVWPMYGTVNNRAVDDLEIATPP